MNAGSWTIALLILFAASVGAASAESAGEKSVAAADEAFYAASVKEGGKAWADFADEDVRLPYAAGRAAIRAYYDKAYARPGFSISWHPTYAHVTGDIGVTSGPYEAHRRNRAGRDVRETGTYVTVWQRQKKGVWRYVWDGGTVDR